MKRTVKIVAAVAVLGTALYLGSRLWAQGAGQAPRPTSKIAVVNLPLVIKNYKKYDLYENQLREMAKKFQEADKLLEEKMNNAKKLMQAPGDNHDAQEKILKDVTREREDKTLDFKKNFSKTQEAQLTQLYREVEWMVKKVAMTNGFEMVLEYGDAIEAKDAYNPMNIQRKVLGGVCLPMYVAPGLDISLQVYTDLNNWYASQQRAGAAGTH